MSIAASVLSQRFRRASRFTEAIGAFFQKEPQKPATQNSRLEKDLLELSPYNQIRQTIAEFQQETSTKAELNLKLTVSSEQSMHEEELDPEIDRDFDLMLRMISKDEKEYKSLRGRYEKLLKQARSAFAGESEKAEAPPVASGQTVSQIAQDSVTRRAYEFDLKFKKQTTSEERIGISLEELGIKQADPLVLDLAGDGLNLTRAGKGAIFDITADGKLDSTAWVQGDDAMLVYDKNGNGKIDDGSELFGDQNGAENGFIELAKHDQNKDKKINYLDPVFKALKLYQDINGNGKIEKNELFSLQEKGISALNLNFVHANQNLNGNSLILNGSFERNDGSSGQLADVLLGYRQL
jgi:hypothetical protein